MRVLHVIPSISPRRGGPSQAVLAMAAAQRAAGIDARILSSDDDGPDQLRGFPLRLWHSLQGVPVLLFPRWSPPLAVLREYAICPELPLWLWRHIREQDLLHVHALFSFPSTAAMAMARSRRVPYLLRSIGQLQHWSLRQRASRKRWMLRLIERSNLEGAAALHFTSAAEQWEAAALALKTPSFVLPLGVELPERRPTCTIPAAKEPFLQWLFLSRLHPKKQLPVLFEALALVRHQAPWLAWQLHIAGEGEPAYVAQLHQQATTLGIQDRLCWHGFVAGEAKQALLDQAHWFLLPSAAENFGISVAEALAHGVPALLSPGVALAEQVAEAGAGWCVEPTPEAFAQALLAQASQPPAQQIRQAARQLAEQRFSWPAITQQLLERYQQVLADAP